jgi:hypothetical protein
MEDGGRMKCGNRGMTRGRIQEEYGKDGDRSEAGRREVGGRSEEFHLNGHSRGMQNPKFRRVDLRILEFKSYLKKEII